MIPEIRLDNIDIGINQVSNLIINDTLTVTENSTLEKNLTIDSNLNVRGTATLENNLIINAINNDSQYSLEVNGDIFTHSNLYTNTLQSATSESNIELYSSIVPNVTDTLDLGSVEKTFKDIFISNDSLWIGDQHKIVVSGNKIKFRKRNTTTIPEIMMCIIMLVLEQQCQVKN